MNKIFLIRHGQDTDNAAGILNGRRDTELTDLGRKQASQVAQKLRDDKIQIILSSPLRRAYETVNIIAKKFGINKVIINKNLIEWDFGVLTGKPISDIPKYTDKILSSDKVDYFLEAEGAEDFPTLFKRGKKVLEEIEQKYSDKNILVVIHGDIGKMIRAVYHGWDWRQGLKAPYFDNTEVLKLSKKKDLIE